MFGSPVTAAFQYGHSVAVPHSNAAVAHQGTGPASHTGMASAGCHAGGLDADFDTLVGLRHNLVGRPSEKHHEPRHADLKKEII